MPSARNSLDILIVGTGAVGTLFASCLQQNPGIRLTLLCRSTYEQIKSHGLRFSKHPIGPVVIKPYDVVSNLSSLKNKTPFDYVVFANKAAGPHADDSWISDLKHIGRNGSTSFVTAQNGVLNESFLHQDFPRSPILSAICYASVKRRSPCLVEEKLRLHPHCFRIGAFTNDQASLDSAHKLVGLGGHDFAFIQDVQVERWKKMVLNASFNATASLFQANTHDITEDPQKRNMAVRLGQETAAVGKAMGVKLNDSIVQDTVEAVRRAPAFEPSTLQDRLMGRRLEVDNICGQVARLGTAIGVKVPNLLAVCHALESINHAQDAANHQITSRTRSTPASLPRVFDFANQLITQNLAAAGPEAVPGA